MGYGEFVKKGICPLCKEKLEQTAVCSESVIDTYKCPKCGAEFMGGVHG